MRRPLAVLFTLLVLPVVALSEDAGLKPDQTVTVVFTSRKKYRGTLVEANSKEVKLRLRPGQAPARYSVAQVAGIITAKDVFTFNKATKRWEGSKSRRPATSVDKKPTPKDGPTTARTEEVKGPPGARTVVAEGVGSDEAEALKDAFRSAIRKVVGALVVSKLTVKDDKVLEDRVLTYSAGIIKEDYKVLSRKKEDDVWRLKIAARVEPRGVASRLVEAGFKVKTDVDGVGLAARVLTRAEARKRATELIRDALADLPKVLVAAARKPTDQDYDEDTKELKIDLVVVPDLKKYDQFLEHLNLVLDKVNVSKSFAVRPAKLVKDGYKEGGPTCFECDSGEAFMKLTLAEEVKGWYLWVLGSRNDTWTRTRWNVFQLDSDFKKSLASLQGRLSVLLTLLDRKGKEITQDEIDLTKADGYAVAYPWLAIAQKSSASTGRSSADNVAIAPLAMRFDGSSTLSFKAVKHIRRKLKLTEGELKRLHTIRCEVLLRKNLK